VRFLAIFIKLTLQTNKKNEFKEAVVSTLIAHFHLFVCIR
jgi:hypothetical protein